MENIPVARDYKDNAGLPLLPGRLYSLDDTRYLMPKSRPSKTDAWWFCDQIFPYHGSYPVGIREARRMNAVQPKDLVLFLKRALKDTEKTIPFIPKWRKRELDARGWEGVFNRVKRRKKS